MRLVFLAALLLPATGAGSEGARTPALPDSIPILGNWQLNLTRTHYGVGVDHRRREEFSCGAEAADRVRCVIRSLRSDGRPLTGYFIVTLDGQPGSVTGLPEVDEVQLSRANTSLVDATFFSHGKPRYGYRALQSEDGRSLIIVGVDPASRVVLTTVVIYDRR